MTPVAYQPYLPITENIWWQVRDGNPHVKDIFDRHYSRRRYTDGRKPKLFVGPGEKMVLILKTGDAILVWRKFISDDGQQGINCAVFRNESVYTSSLLIQEAERLCWARWPGERLYTYVNPSKVKSPNPGYCFKSAGWTVAGHNKRHTLVILEKFPCEPQ